MPEGLICLGTPGARCGHSSLEHGSNRCMALLPSGEPCECTHGHLDVLPRNHVSGDL